MQLNQHIQLPIFEIISKAAEELNSPAFVIGGFVRDALLERPCKDIDIVTSGDGIRLAKHIASKIGNSNGVTIFKKYGTAMLHWKDFQVEFVGARKESYSSDSRKPKVEAGSLEDDQNRRDFTINALAISLNKDNFGELIDPFNGVEDLEKKIIRTPLDPEVTYSDDPLRMMRAIRFATQLKFKIHPESFEAIKDNLDRIGIVSQERITDELNKIILATKPSDGFKLLNDCGLIDKIFPEMAALKGIDFINGKGHKDNFFHTIKVLDNLSKNTNDLWLRWAAILHDIAKPDTKRFENKVGWTFHGHDDLGAKMVPGIFRRLKLPLDHKMKYVQKLVKLHLRPIALVKEIVSDSAIRRLLIEASDDIDDLMMLCEADVTTKNKDKQKKFHSNFKEVRKKLKEVEEKDHLRNWQPPISGEEIMKIFNLKPSRYVGLIKNAIREAILEGEIQNNYQEAFGFMVNEAKKYNLKPVEQET